MDTREFIDRRVAREFKSGAVVNLGTGMPTMVADYIPKGIEIIFQSENGLVGMGPAPEPGGEDKDLVNAGNKPVTALPGAAFFDSALSFGIIRGGHVDYTVLGALEVDQEGNLANWIIPGKMVPEGLLLMEIAPGFSVRNVQDSTEADLIVSPEVKVMFSEQEKAA